MIKGKEMTFRITLNEEGLGMMPADPKVHEEFIASKAPDAQTLEEEVEAMGVEEVVEKQKTVFPKLEDGTPFVWDYQIKGFFKDALGMLRRMSGSESSKLKAYKRVVDGMVHIEPRKIPITLPEGGKLGDCQRPLRASTAQGDRVALANSETIPAGSTFTFTINLLDKTAEKALRECLDYAELRGFFQWRNSGKGTAYWEELDEHGNVIAGNKPTA